MRRLVAALHLMASRWFYRIFDQEMGPVGFQDLVEMVRAGTLTEDDRVRRESNEEWIRAREVIGLFRAARGPEAEAKPPKAEATPTAPEPKPAIPQPQRADAPPAIRPRRWRIPRFGPRTWIGLAIGLVVAAIVGYECWAHRRSRVFPESAFNRPRPVNKQAFESIRAPRPSVPSVPGLKEGVATLVPGLEQIDPIFCACLTPDLRTIVFSAKPKPEAPYDLFIAARDDVSAPFGKPERIDACSTPGGDVYPTLSPDGLELIYMQYRKPQYLFHAKRDSTSSRFAEPKAWLIPGVDPAKERAAGPRFLDSRRVFFLIVRYAGLPRACFLAERAGAKSDFGSPQPVKTSGVILPYVFLLPDSPRVYFPKNDGLHLLVRPNQDVLGGEDILVASAKTMGTIFDTRIWVAPQEDVVFYNSTGPGKDPKPGPNDEGRKLWMFRF